MYGWVFPGAEFRVFHHAFKAISDPSLAKAGNHAITELNDIGVIKSFWGILLHNAFLKQGTSSPPPPPPPSLAPIRSMSEHHSLYVAGWRWEGWWLCLSQSGNKISFLSGKALLWGLRTPAAARQAVKPRPAFHWTALLNAHCAASAVLRALKSWLNSKKITPTGAERDAKKSMKVGTSYPLQPPYREITLLLVSP